MSKAATLAGFATGITPPSDLIVGIVTASNVSVANSVTATTFYGSGSNLTGIAATAVIQSDSITVSGVTTVSAGSAAAPSIVTFGDNNTGVFFPAGDAVAIANGGGESARFDSSSRLLLGTSTSVSVLGENAVQLFGEGLGGSLSLTRTGATTQSANLVFGRTRGDASTRVSLNNDDVVGRIYFVGDDGTDIQTPAALIQVNVDGTPGANDMPGRLVFSTTADGASSPTERMRISNDGTHYTRGTTAVFSFASNAAAGTTNWLQLGGHSASSISGYTISYAVYTNGNVVNTNGSYTAISDVKLKENIVDANSQWDDIKAIRIRNWNFKEETGHETHRQIGPIAQELELISPGIVFETPDRDEDGNETGEVTKGVNQSILYMKALKALQEAMERIEALEANNTDLLARVTALEA